jgi:hypothetical protein
VVVNAVAEEERRQHQQQQEPEPHQQLFDIPTTVEEETMDIKDEDEVISYFFYAVPVWIVNSAWE